MYRRAGLWTLIGSFAMATAFSAAQGAPQGAGASLPSGITALAPSPPSGIPPDPASVARGTVLYETTLACAPCHGLTGRGGPSNAPDVTLVLAGVGVQAAPAASTPIPTLSQWALIPLILLVVVIAGVSRRAVTVGRVKE